LSDLPLSGLRVLLLEDEVLIALDVEQLCRDAGAAHVGVVHSLAQMQEGAIALTDYDAAILDVMLQGQSTAEQAQALAATGIPFVFATGYVDGHQIFDEFPDITVVGKPYVGAELVEALARCFSRKRPSSDGSPEEMVAD
jgi:CheY-like chemotaxis protein